VAVGADHVVASAAPQTPPRQPLVQVVVVVKAQELALRGRRSSRS
jgi:hypothetical protein